MDPLRASLMLFTLLCVAAVARATSSQVIRIGRRFKLSDISDSNLRQTLESIGQHESSVQELDLSGNTLRNITAEDLERFEGLQVLDVSSNLITGTIDLSSLSTIRRVDLSNNLLSEVLLGTPIESVVAVNNRIERMSCSGQAPKRIILSDNRLTELADLAPTCLGGVVNLDLSFNKLTTMDFTALSESRSSLRTLNLEYNDIVTVHNSQKVVFSTLTVLDVSSNKIPYLGDAFEAAAATVENFDASNNVIVSVSPTLTFHRRTERFDLRGNSFRCGSLRKFYRTNEFLYQISAHTLRQQAAGADRESCAENWEHVGPYCCSQSGEDADFSTPFVDELIQARRKEVIKQSHKPGPSADDRAVCCEKQCLDKLRKVQSVRAKYRTAVDEKSLAARDAVLLVEEKCALQKTLDKKRAETDEMEALLRDTAAALSLPAFDTVVDTLEIAGDLVRKFDETYAEESGRLRDAETDAEKYERYIVKLEREKIRLQQNMAHLSEKYGIWMYK